MEEQKFPEQKPQVPQGQKKILRECKYEVKLQEETKQLFTLNKSLCVFWHYHYPFANPNEQNVSLSKLLAKRGAQKSSSEYREFSSPPYSRIKTPTLYVMLYFFWLFSTFTAIVSLSLRNLYLLKRCQIALAVCMLFLLMSFSILLNEGQVVCKYINHNKFQDFTVDFCFQLIAGEAALTFTIYKLQKMKAIYIQLFLAKMSDQARQFQRAEASNVLSATVSVPQ